MSPSIFYCKHFALYCKQGCRRGDDQTLALRLCSSDPLFLSRQLPHIFSLDYHRLFVLYCFLYHKYRLQTPFFLLHYIYSPSLLLLTEVLQILLWLSAVVFDKVCCWTQSSSTHSLLCSLLPFPGQCHCVCAAVACERLELAYHNMHAHFFSGTSQTRNILCVSRR